MLDRGSGSFVEIPNAVLLMHLFLSTCVGRRISTLVSCSQRPEEGVRSAGTGVEGSCEPALATGIKLESSKFYKSSKLFCPQSLSLPSLGENFKG